MRLGPSIILFLFIASSLASPTYDSLYTFYSGSDEALGTSWEGVASIEATTGNTSKICNLLLSDSGDPPYYGSGILSSPGSKTYLTPYGTYSGYTSLKKLQLGGSVFSKCVVTPGWSLSGNASAILEFLYDAVTTQSYALIHDEVNLFDPATAKLKPIAQFVGPFGNYAHAWAVANNTLIGVGVGDSGSTVWVTNLLTKVTTSANFTAQNGLLPSSPFFFNSTWFFIGTNVVNTNANVSATLLSFDPVHLKLRVASGPIYPLISKYANLRAVGGPLVDSQGFLYVLDEEVLSLLVYDLNRRSLVAYNPLTFGAFAPEVGNIDFLIA